MKHIKKFESFSVNEELVSAIEVQAYKRMTQEIKTVLIDLEESEKAPVDEPKGY
jgi:stress response protein YsnF